VKKSGGPDCGQHSMGPESFTRPSRAFSRGPARPSQIFSRGPARPSQICSRGPAGFFHAAQPDFSTQDPRPLHAAQPDFSTQDPPPLHAAQPDFSTQDPRRHPHGCRKMNPRQENSPSTPESTSSQAPSSIRFFISLGSILQAVTKRSFANKPASSTLLTVRRIVLGKMRVNDFSDFFAFFHI
jgi:hypothetical protein